MVLLLQDTSRIARYLLRAALVWAGLALAPAAWAITDITFPTPLPDAAVTQPYRFVFVPVGAVLPTALVWSMTEPIVSVDLAPLPCVIPGLTLDTATGALGGTPTAAGTYNCFVNASDYSNPNSPTQVSKAFVLTVIPACTPPAITSAPLLPPATQGQPYNFTVTASGAPTPAITVVGLPAGMQFDPATNRISGTPGAAASYPLTITATNGCLRPAVQAATFVVNCTAPTITSGPLPAGTLGAPYAFTLGASGNPQPTIAVVGLPPGLQFDPATNRIAGTPTASSVFQLTITATSSCSPPAVQVANLAINCTAPTITSGPPPVAPLGLPYAFTVTAAGNPVPALEVVGLPPGLQFDLATSRIVGTPNASGVFQLTISATSSCRPAAAQVVLLTVTCTPPAITSAPLLPNAPVGLPYSFTVTATGNPQPALDAVGLPPGLQFDPATGKITGTPTSSGSYQLTITAASSCKPAATQIATLPVTCTPPSITSAIPPAATINSPYSFPVSAAGSPAPTLAVNGLPAGLSFNPLTGLINGTPTVAGTSSVTITATSSCSPPATQAVNFVVACTPPSITSGAPPQATLGVPYSFPVSASGVPLPTVAVSGLPSGLSFSPATGFISGTPAAAGTSNVTITATSSCAPPATRVVPLEVVCTAPTITTATPPNATLGVPYSFPVNATGVPAPTITVLGLPSGLLFNANTGTISGTPSAPGTFSVSVVAASACAPPAAQVVSFVVGCTPPSFTSGLPPGATLGVPYSFTVAATGVPSPGLSVSGLPAGLSFNANTGVISGTPTAAGTSMLTIAATSACTPPATQTPSLVVACTPPTFTSGTLPPATLGSPYDFPVAATGVPAPSISVSGLPAGLAFSATTGRISGTPTVAGNASVALTAQSACAPPATQLQILGVARLAAALTLASTPNPAVYGQTIAATVRATGGLSTPQGTVALCVREAANTFCPAPFDNVPAGTPPDRIRTPLSAPLDANGQATFAIANLAIDNFVLKASFGGDAGHDPALSLPVDQFVIKGLLLGKAKVAIGAPPSAAARAPIVIGISVAPDGGGPMPTGEVYIVSGSGLLGVATLDRDGAAQVRVTPTSPGEFTVSAVYQGDGYFAPAASTDAVVNVTADAGPVADIPTLSTVFLALLALMLAAAGAIRLARRARKR